MQKGNYLYYGFKISENEMIKIMLQDEEFLAYMKNYAKYDKEIKNIGFNKQDITHDQMSLLKGIISEYYNINDDISENDLGINWISNSCCAYNDVSDWVIGFKLCHVKAFKEDILPVKIHFPTKGDTENLMSLKKKLNIDSEINYYSISSDCWCCS